MVLPLSAQNALPASHPQCLFRADDDMHWAAENLDESAWWPISDWPEQQSIGPDVWIRCRLAPPKLATSAAPVLEVTADAAYEIYVDGKPLASFGNLSTGAHTEGIANQYECASLFERTHLLQIAVRFAFMPTVYGQLPQPSILIGDSVQLRNGFEGRTWIFAALLGLAALIVFIREQLWIVKHDLRL